MQSEVLTLHLSWCSVWSWGPWFPAVEDAGHRTQDAVWAMKTSPCSSPATLSARQCPQGAGHRQVGARRPGLHGLRVPWLWPKCPSGLHLLASPCARCSLPTRIRQVDEATLHPTLSHRNHNCGSSSAARQLPGPGWAILSLLQAMLRDNCVGAEAADGPSGGSSQLGGNSASTRKKASVGAASTLCHLSPCRAHSGPRPALSKAARSHQSQRPCQDAASSSVRSLSSVTKSLYILVVQATLKTPSLK